MHQLSLYACMCSLFVFSKIKYCTSCFLCYVLNSGISHTLDDVYRFNTIILCSSVQNNTSVDKMYVTFILLTLVVMNTFKVVVEWTTCFTTLLSAFRYFFFSHYLFLVLMSTLHERKLTTLILTSQLVVE